MYRQCQTKRGKAGLASVQVCQVPFRAYIYVRIELLNDLRSKAVLAKELQRLAGAIVVLWRMHVLAYEELPVRKI